MGKIDDLVKGGMMRGKEGRNEGQEMEGRNGGSKGRRGKEEGTQGDTAKEWRR